MYCEMTKVIVLLFLTVIVQLTELLVLQVKDIESRKAA